MRDLEHFQFEKLNERKLKRQLADKNVVMIISRNMRALLFRPT